jgi:hypothetical protein
LHRRIAVCCLDRAPVLDQRPQVCAHGVAAPVIVARMGQRHVAGHDRVEHIEHHIVAGMEFERFDPRSSNCEPLDRLFNGMHALL